MSLSSPCLLPYLITSLLLLCCCVPKLAGLRVSRCLFPGFLTHCRSSGIIDVCIIGITDVCTIGSGVLVLQMCTLLGQGCCHYRCVCALLHQAFHVGSGNLNSDLHTSVASSYPLSYLLDIPSPKVIIVFGNTL